MLLKKLYTVEKHTEVDAQQHEFIIEINKDHEIFKGHFPGNPVMPGVCMIQIIKNLTETVVQETLFLENSSNIKFMAKINPEETSRLHITITINKEDGLVKVKNITKYNEVTALKLNANFKITA